MTREERTVRAGRRTKTDRFTVASRDGALRYCEFSRADAKQLVLDLIELIDEPMTWQPVPAPSRSGAEADRGRPGEPT